MIKPLIITGGPEHWALPEFLEQISDWIQAPHLVTPTTVGSLELSSHKADGTAFFGTGNSTDHYIHLFDHTSNIEFGLEDHYRTGAYVDPVKIAGAYVATMDAGHQTNGLHQEQGTNVNRSAASVDVSMNFGNEGPTDGKFVLDVNGHDFTLAHTGNNWYFADNHGAPALGLTLSPDGHVLQDSVNFGFHAFSYLAHTSENSGDLAAQDVHVSLTEMVGTVGVAQVSETIHLTGHPVEIT